MPMQDLFRAHIAKLVTGEGVAGDYFNEANSYIGVGNGGGAIDSSHTDLQGASKLRRAMRAGYPTRTNNVIIYQARFEEADANFEWLEGGIFNAETSGLMMNRFLDNQGTKPNDEIWDYEVTVTIDHPA